MPKLVQVFNSKTGVTRLQAVPTWSEQYVKRPLQRLAYNIGLVCIRLSLWSLRGIHAPKTRNLARLASSNFFPRLGGDTAVRKPKTRQFKRTAALNTSRRAMVHQVTPSHSTGSEVITKTRKVNIDLRGEDGW